MKLSTIVLLLSIAVPGMAKADVTEALSDYEAIESACMKRDSSSQGMQACEAERFKSTDKLLNDVFQKLRTVLNADQTANGKIKVSRLANAEIAWIAFKDAECKLTGIASLGGTNESLQA